MKTENKNLPKLLAILTILIGVLALLFMITVENEPGAIPLILIIAGTGWYLVSSYKSRKSKNGSA